MEKAGKAGDRGLCPKDRRPEPRETAGEACLCRLRRLDISRRDGRKLVRGLSFSLEPGESLGIVGESGSGKTLTCKALLDLLPEGLRWEAEERLVPERTAMIFQNPQGALDPLCPVFRQLCEVIEAHGTDPGQREGTTGEEGFRREPAGEAGRRRGPAGNSGRRGGSAADSRRLAASLLERLSLPAEWEKQDRYPWELSGGQCQRILIAMALACRPRLLICDEPTTALDVTVQRQTLDLLRSLQSEWGFGMIFVTHNLAVAAGMCSRLLVLKEGEMVETGSCREILTAPREEYTRRLLASVPRVPELSSRRPT